MTHHSTSPNHFVRFDRPIFGQYDIFVRLNEGLTEVDWERFLLDRHSRWWSSVGRQKNLSPPDHACISTWGIWLLRLQDIQVVHPT